MMIRAGILTLTLLAACTEPGTPLSELPSPELAITAGPRSVEVEIRYKHMATKPPQPCAVLGSDVEATVNGMPMTLIERGATKPGGCTWPVLQLDHPAAAAQTTLVVRDPSLTITADLADVLAPRSAQLVPDGPWTFAPGQAITVQWSPASDLTQFSPYTAFVYDDPRGTGILSLVPATINGDRITVRTPDVTFSEGTFQVTLYKAPPGGIDPPPSCTGATCSLTRWPQFAHLIDVQ